MNITTSSIGIIFLLLMAFNFGTGRSKKNTFGDKLFSSIIIINIVLMSIDIILWLLYKKTFDGAVTLHLIVAEIYGLTFAALCLLWQIYCENKLFQNLHRLKKRLPYYLIPTFFMAVCIVISFFRPFLFTVNAANILERGPYFYIGVGLCSLQILYALFLTLKAIKADKSHLQRNRNISLLSFPLFAFFTATMQALFKGIDVFSMGILISLMIIYFNLQSMQITTDDLTSLSNRRRFNSYLEYKLRNRQEDTILFMLIIDIDFFKNINDTFGHLVGDKALKQIAQILIRALPRNDFIARIGGDEFAVIGERKKVEDIATSMDSIQKELTAFNQSHAALYYLSITIGAGYIEKEQKKTAEELTAEADENMYLQRQIKDNG